MFLAGCLLLTAASLFSGVYTFKNQTVRLFVKWNPTDERVKKRAVRNVGTMYFVGTIGLIISTILYYTTSVGMQPFVLLIPVMSAWSILLRIDLKSY